MTSKNLLLRGLRALGAYLLVMALPVLSLSGCGGGGSVPYSGVEIRPLTPDYLTRRAINYSPFRTSASSADLASEVIPAANIRQDLDLMLAAGFRLIRLFDSSDKVARQTLQLIRTHNLNMKVHLGSYVVSGNEAASVAELARTVVLANEFPDIVLAVSVGNETMVSWSPNKIEPAVMARYIRKVRSQIKQPVTTDDNYAFWAAVPTLITDEIDFVALHTYAELDTVFDPTRWDWKQLGVPAGTRAQAMMDAALAETKRQYQQARAYIDSKGLSYIPIVIGETGWNAVNLGRLRFRASPVNQKMYLDRLDAWMMQSRSANSGPRQVFYFQAFDEPWKQGDDQWGLFNKDRQARYAIQSINRNGAPAGTAIWTYEPVAPEYDLNRDGAYSEADAQSFQPAAVGSPISATRYTLYSDKPLAASEVRASGLRWDAFDGITASYAEISEAYAPGDASQSFEIRPQPVGYGWGLLHYSATEQADNLSGYAATGFLNFTVSTTYPGKIEIGISTDTAERETQEAYLQIEPGRYGYCSTGAWCQVSIPLRDFLAMNPKLDLSMVLARFIIADRYAFTGKASGAGHTNRIRLDNIHWSR